MNLSCGHDHETMLNKNIHGNNYYCERKGEQRKSLKKCTIKDCENIVYKEDKCFKHWYLNKENINE